MKIESHQNERGVRPKSGIACDVRARMLPFRWRDAALGGRRFDGGDRGNRVLHRSILDRLALCISIAGFAAKQRRDGATRERIRGGDCNRTKSELAHD